MKIGSNQLSYCTNVHPAETYAELLETLQSDVASVKAKVAPNQSFGVGLRLSAQMVLSMDSRQVDKLKSVLNAHDMYVFSVNGFPYGDFGVGIVKAAVYEPGWDDERRVAYTCALARVLAQLPGPQKRTISTVALGYKPKFDDADRVECSVQNLKAVCETLKSIHQETGVHIELCLEPEPGTYLETCEDVLAFFLAYGLTCDNNEVGYLSICYDTCHQAVMFETPRDCMHALHEAGIRIGKIQISNAIVLEKPADDAARRALMAFQEPRFLHQVVAESGTLFAIDLPELEQPSELWRAANQWRCHFHVPLHWQGSTLLKSTHGAWKDALAYAIEAQLCTHYEIETYTWSVLPKTDFDTTDLTQSIAQEFAAVTPYFEQEPK